MVAQITTEVGDSIPPHREHSITFHAPEWSTVESWIAGDMSLLMKLKSVYPRFGVFFNVQKLIMALAKKFEFPDGHAAAAWVCPEAIEGATKYATDPRRKECKLEPNEILPRVIDVNGVRLYLVVFPAQKAPGVIGYWQHPGLGISSRIATSLLPHVESATEVPIKANAPLPAPTFLPEVDAHPQLRARIAHYLNRARRFDGAAAAKTEDVYLFPTGMAGLYRMHRYLNLKFGQKSIMFGTLFHSSEDILEDYGSGFIQVLSDDPDAISKLKKALVAEAGQGRKIQAVYLEFPANPTLVCAPLKELRALADEHDFVLVVDDTVGSFCNVDILPFADVLATSLTKSFSGYADVMAGSLVLNPASPKYGWLKEMVTSSYRNEFFAGDAETLLKNSDDYLERSTILNRNSLAVVEYLQSKAEDPTSGVKRVYYPTTSERALATYKEYMRPATAEYTPGYGCLLSIDFDSKESAVKFYDTLEVHKGPHLGANRTLCFACNIMVFGKDPKVKARAEAAGLYMSQMRIAPGFDESADELIEIFKSAVEAVDQVRNSGADGLI